MDRVTGALVGLAIALFLLFGVWCCEVRRRNPQPEIEVANLSGGVESRHAVEAESQPFTCGLSEEVGHSRLITSGSSAPPAQTNLLVPMLADSEMSASSSKHEARESITSATGGFTADSRGEQFTLNGGVERDGWYKKPQPSQRRHAGYSAKAKSQEPSFVDERGEMPRDRDDSGSSAPPAQFCSDWTQLPSVEVRP